jgi:hypothetical protein
VGTKRECIRLHSCLCLNDDNDRHDRHDHPHCDHYEYHLTLKKKINPPVFGSSQEDWGTFSFSGPGRAYVYFEVQLSKLAVVCLTMGTQ